MANPTVDKLKAFGLRHGEKVAMGVVSVIFVACAYFAWSHPTIEVTADEVQDTAKRAKANIQAPQKMETILAKLTDLGVKPQDFEKKVDKLQTGIVDASKYKLEKPFVTPEPGAGLIRDMPELLAPVQLLVHSGRGAVRVYVLDDEGKPKPKPDADEKKAQSKTKKSTKGRSGLGGGMMGGLAGNSRKKGTGTLAENEKKKEEEEKQRQKERSLAGAAETKKDDDTPVEEEGLNPETTESALHGYRVVTIVGKFDHKKQKEIYAKALKEDAASAAPHYLRLDVERQNLNGDNTWGAWAPINRKRFEEVDSVLTKAEDELVPTESLLKPLVDRLPFMEVGYWVGAHHRSLVPDEVAKPKSTVDKTKGGPGGKGGMNAMGGGNQFNKSDYDKMGAGAGRPGGGDYGAGMAGGLGFDPGSLAGSKGGAPGGAAQGDFDKSSADWLMIRALDFDVKPDASYRYRVRIVVANPNLGWSESVSPGVDTKAKEIKGPWSAITTEVSVPPDVATYAMRKTPSGADASGEKTEFQVVAWNEADGLTIVHKFDQGPGEVIGQKQKVSLPNDAKDGIVSKLVDFTSHQILADAIGGARPASDIKPLGLPVLEVPATALVVRSDGLLVIRDQAKDASSGEMAEMKAIYDQIMKDAQPGKKKSNSSLTGAYGGGMSGAYGGGMGGIQGAN